MFFFLSCPLGTFFSIPESDEMVSMVMVVWCVPVSGTDKCNLGLKPDLLFVDYHLSVQSWQSLYQFRIVVVSYQVFA